MSGVDASFLVNESDSAHMQIGALLVCAGPGPGLDAFRDQIGRRLDRIPRFRQRLAWPPGRLGRPFWVDDPNVDLRHHVRALSVSSHRTERELAIAVEAVFSDALDRTRPLWELWLVEGLEDDRFAVIYKAHHALADGIADVQVGSLLFDPSPTPDPPTDPEPWDPGKPPAARGLAALSLEELGTASGRLARAAVAAARQPTETARQAREAVEAVAEVTRSYLDAAPTVPLNAEIGGLRSFTWRSCDLEELRETCKAMGGTVNDGVLAIAAGALRSWLSARGLSTGGRELQALVPISIRRGNEREELGNRLAAIRAPLPVQIADPVERFSVVQAATERLKRSKQPLGAQIVSRYLPWLNFSTRLFNLLVTNLPGPPLPLFVMGGEVEQIVPVAFLAKRHALAIATLSYNGRLHMGLIGDRIVHPPVELEAIGSDLERSLYELIAAGESAAGREIATV
jgi:WS/DGAT/MGAT family acyltransferase